MKQYTVEYQIETYRGIVIVWADEDASNEHIIALAKQKLIKSGGGWIGYESFKVRP